MVLRPPCWGSAGAHLEEAGVVKAGKRRPQFDSHLGYELAKQAILLAAPIHQTVCSKSTGLSPRFAEKITEIM